MKLNWFEMNCVTLAESERKQCGAKVWENINADLCFIFGGFRLSDNYPSGYQRRHDLQRY